MPSLQVRELPEHLYAQLCREAEIEHRSIAQQAVATLARGLNLGLDLKTRRIALLEEIRASAPAPAELPDPASLIREDRER